MGDLASAEERIEAADQQLAADESEEAASGRDLRVLRQQLSAMRLALVEARARLAEQEVRLTSCPAEEEEAGKKQVGWWLGGGVCAERTWPALQAMQGDTAVGFARMAECRNNSRCSSNNSCNTMPSGRLQPFVSPHAARCPSPQALLLELQGCREDVAQMREVQRKAAELAEENRQLQAR